MNGCITTQREGGLLTLNLARSAKQNAITPSMYSVLADQFVLAAQDPEIRAVLLLGHERAFCAGTDLTSLHHSSPDSRSDPVTRFMHALLSCPKPVVAGVCGLASGTGATLLLHCDLVYCGENTTLQLPFVELGLCPDFASTLLVPLIAGPARAAELLMLGEPFSAQKALAMGLVTRLVANAEVQSVAREKALQLTRLDPSAVRTTKKLLRRWNEPQVLGAIKAEVDEFVPMLSSPQAQEALAAFAEKRLANCTKSQ